MLKRLTQDENCYETRLVVAVWHWCGLFKLVHLMPWEIASEGLPAVTMVLVSINYEVTKELKSSHHWWHTSSPHTEAQCPTVVFVVILVSGCQPKRAQLCTEYKSNRGGNAVHRLREGLRCTSESLLPCMFWWPHHRASKCPAPEQL